MNITKYFLLAVAVAFATATVCYVFKFISDTISAFPNLG